ncbi:MAG TPA: acyl-CoA dehydrogenase family protein [Pseudonocardiaceae bacterium]|nr:acyl-CoA dehydrogenase family protein [Pseudonocardiaceae bacterium]
MTVRLSRRVPVMYIELSGEHIAYRDRLRAHIAANRPDLPRPPGTRSPRTTDLPDYRAWCASLFREGFIGLDWPREWGGRGEDDPIRDYILDQELADAGVPRPIGAYNLVATPLLRYGTRAQQELLLPRIRGFADLWCQLFSEPEAGSDLAALRTRARRDGEHWIVDGQKVWTTHAHIADMGFLLARTDQDAGKHAGISAFLLDMSSPGIEVRPLRELTGSSDFNEVFFDQVRIPHAAMLGESGQGWEIARAALVHERGQSLREDSVTAAVHRLVRLARDRNRLADQGIRRTIGRLAARAQISDLLGLRGVLRDAAGTSGPADAAVTKVVFTEANLDAATFGVELQEADGILDGRWQEAFLWARGFTISAGSNEIMRNLIAERGLGLPREK